MSLTESFFRFPAIHERCGCICSLWLGFAGSLSSRCYRVLPPFVITILLMANMLYLLVLKMLTILPQEENRYIDQAQDLDFAHISWHKLKEDLTNVCTNMSSWPIPEYARVHVVLLNWLEDDLGTINELIELEKLFKDWFDYSTEVWRIPSGETAEFELGLKLCSVAKQHGGKDDLLIVYYGGHSEEDPYHQTIWRA